MPSDEQQFHIQPHPAKDNVDADQIERQHGGLGSALDGLDARQQQPLQGKPGPFVPQVELEKPKSREELQALAQSLNKE